jgi:uncharacterized damage-inducible protein DinB
MKVAADVLRMHLDYAAWASSRLLNAAAALTEEQLSRDFATADRSVIGTLVHLFGADRIWLRRVRGEPGGSAPGPEFRHVGALAPAWQDVLEQWRNWAAPMTDADFDQVIAYHDMKGNPWRTPLWQVVLHVVNHGTHHRGQVAGFLRSMGVAPPPLDLIAYYRGSG